MASLRKVGKTYYVRYKKGEKEFTEKLGSNLTKRVAEQLLRRVEARLAWQKQDEIDKAIGVNYKKMYLNLLGK